MVKEETLESISEIEELIKIYEDNTSELIEKGIELRDVKEQNKKVRKEIRNLMWEILNNINNDEKTTINKEITIRDGRVYLWKSTNVITVRHIVEDKSELLEKIIDSADQKYREKLRQVFEEIKENRSLINAMSKSKNKKTVTNVPHDFRLLDYYEYQISASYSNSGEIAVEIRKNNNKRKIKMPLQWINHEEHIAKKVLYHKDEIEESLEDSIDDEKNKHKELQKIRDNIVDNFSGILVATNL